MNRIYPYIALIILFNACSYTGSSQMSNSDKLLIKNNLNSKNQGAARIKFNGFYADSSSMVWMDNELNYVPAIFFDNNTVLDIRCKISKEQLEYCLNHTRDKVYECINGFNCFSWGTYEVRGDTVKAIIITKYRSSFPRWKYYSIYYQGIIKDANTIADWHVVPPYSKALPAGNVYTQVVAQLKFNNLDLVKRIDPSKSWITTLK